MADLVLCFSFKKIIGAYIWFLFWQCLVKPSVKEITRPLDLVLHSDIRAVERAEFDHQAGFLFLLNCPSSFNYISQGR